MFSTQEKLSTEGIDENDERADFVVQFVRYLNEDDIEKHMAKDGHIFIIDCIISHDNQETKIDSRTLKHLH